MPSPTKPMDWSIYAQKYDMLIAYNPYYQDLQKEVLAIINDWQPGPNDIVTDIAGGTGNYSTAIAQAYPNTKVIHVDQDPGMIQVTQAKKTRLELENLEVLQKGVGEITFGEGTITMCICIHAFYTFPDPLAIMKKMYDWLDDGGLAVFVDPGRPVNVWGWKLAIGWRMLMKYGLNKTLEVMKEGRIVAEQNQRIQELQRNGTYWTHTHEAFLSTIEKAGFKILTSRKTFRQLSDLAVVQKV